MWSYSSYNRGQQSQCKYLNISVCDISGTWETSIPDDQFDIFVYNPLGRQMSTLTRFPVPGPDWTLLDKKTPDANSRPIQTLQIAQGTIHN